MKRLIGICFCLLLAAALPAKTPYERFVSKKNVKSAGSELKLYQDGKNLFLEIPDSLDGRTVLLSSILRSSSSPWLSPGREVSAQPAYILSRTDSLLLLKEPTLLPESADSLIGTALNRSYSLPTAFAFPVKYRGNGTLVANVTALFDPTDKKVVDLKGVQLDEYARFYSGTLQSELTQEKGLVAFNRSVGVVRQLTFGAAPSYAAGPQAVALTEETQRITGEFVTTISLLDEKEMKPREADPRIGVRSVRRSLYSPGAGVKTRSLATRWKVDAGEKITVYVDTLFPAAWQQAIRKALLAWNPAFEAAGLGRVVDVRPYASYIGFSPEDPFVSTVRADVHGQGQQIGASVLTHPSTGEILSCTITVPGALIDAIREEGIWSISDVDARYAGYDLPQDAVTEALKAKMMGVFGRVLGLQANMAGSRAYTPAQLRNPSFTQVNGITASVTDEVTFNLLARPGDRERGVVTVSDKIGAYDRFAIDWLYRVFPEGTDEKQALRDMLAEKAGKDAYLFLPARSGNPDPRALSGDLGNDPFALYIRSRERLAFVADHAMEWFAGAGLETTSFRELFAERLLMRFLSVSRQLSYWIGGICLQDLSTGTKATAVPKAVQQQVIATLCASFEDLSWLDRKDLLQWSGANRSWDRMVRVNEAVQSGLVSRIDWVAAGPVLAGSDYPLTAYLDDLTAALFKEVKTGRMPVGDDLLTGSYIAIGLIRRSPLLTRRSAERSHKISLTDASLTMPLGEIPAEAQADVEAACIAQLLKIKKLLRGGIAVAASEGDRSRMEYVLKVVEDALHNEQQ